MKTLALFIASLLLLSLFGCTVSGNQAAAPSNTQSPVAVQHSVNLAWTASPSAVVGYNVYRGTDSGGPYGLLNPSSIAGLSYDDNTVASGATYYYVVAAVSSTGTESASSNQATAVIPAP